MIDRKSIMQWGETHPWNNKAFVEQDLVICRALVTIYSDPFLSNVLAFRGGTALHKLFLAPQVRYSEDIDLVQIVPGPIKPIVERLDKALEWLPKKSFDNRRFGFRMRFRYDSEIPPIEPMRLKVEVNTCEHFTEFGYVNVPFAVANPWFSGECQIRTYTINEHLGTKMRALYQRKKGRDLFDMQYALRNANLDVDAVIRCWRRYVTLGDKPAPSADEFIANLQGKLGMHDYCRDVDVMLRPGTSFDVNVAFDEVREKIIEKI